MKLKKIKITPPKMKVNHYKHLYIQDAHNYYHARFTVRRKTTKTQYTIRKYYLAGGYQWCGLAPVNTLKNYCLDKDIISEQFEFKTKDGKWIKLNLER